ncbi:AaceriACR195Wp [[Ashbya] aceris (nom. inval.)]|nr:AaceriACR195Wp [[Ashbya] aceris (nom. inval.)]
MVSNILSVFNPPPSRDLTQEETKDCLPCQLMSSAFALGFGSYLLSGRAFRYNEKDKAKGITLEEFNRYNPAWWRNSLRTFGGGLVLLGLVRGTEGWLWNTDKYTGEGKSR